MRNRPLPPIPIEVTQDDEKTVPPPKRNKWLARLSAKISTFFSRKFLARKDNKEHVYEITSLYQEITHIYDYLEDSDQDDIKPFLLEDKRLSTMKFGDQKLDRVLPTMSYKAKKFQQSRPSMLCEVKQIVKEWSSKCQKVYSRLSLLLSSLCKRLLAYSKIPVGHAHSK